MSERQATTSSFMTVLDVLAKELEILSAHGLNLESSLTGLSLRTEMSSETIEHLQSVDVILQHLSELRTFTLGVVSNTHEDAPANCDQALAGIKLQALQNRMAAALGKCVKPEASSIAGRLELL